MQINTNASSAYFYNNSLRDTNKTTPKKEETQEKLEKEGEAINNPKDSYELSEYESFMNKLYKQLENEGKSQSEITGIMNYLTAASFIRVTRESIAEGKGMNDTEALAKNYKKSYGANEIQEEVEILQDPMAIGPNIAKDRALTQEQSKKAREDSIATLLRELSGKSEDFFLNL